MSIVARYLTRMFVGYLLLVLIGAVALLQLFDVMSNADGLLQDLGGGVSVVLRYTLLRLPILITFLLPFSVLIASLMTFGSLHRHSELVAMQALGMPFTRILAMLTPCMVLVMGLDFLISDQITPKATRSLAAWQASVEPGAAADIALWLRDGRNVVSVGSIGDHGRSLMRVVIFRRDGKGNLIEQVSADRAAFGEDGWVLLGVDDLTVEPDTRHNAVPLDRMAWPTDLTPNLVSDLAVPPNALSIAKLRKLLKRPEIGSRPIHVYRTWLHKSFAVPLASLFMMALASASVRGLQRQGGIVLNALVGFGGAFLYFIIDGVLLALGEAGSIAPVAAAWLPLAVLALCAGAVLYWVTMPRGRRKAAAPPAGLTATRAGGAAP